MTINLNSWSYLAHFFLEREKFQTKFVDEIKTHILCPITFFFRKSCLLWDKVEKYCTTGQVTDGKIIRRMRVACWKHKATNTHLEYVMLITFPLTKLLQEKVLNITLYVQCLSCLKSLHARTHTSTHIKILSSQTARNYIARLSHNSKIMLLIFAPDSETKTWRFIANMTKTFLLPCFLAACSVTKRHFVGEGRRGKIECLYTVMCVSQYCILSRKASCCPHTVRRISRISQRTRPILHNIHTHTHTHTHTHIHTHTHTHTSTHTPIYSFDWISFVMVYKMCPK